MNGGRKEWKGKEIRNEWIEHQTVGERVELEKGKKQKQTKREREREREEKAAERSTNPIVPFCLPFPLNSQDFLD